MVKYLMFSRRIYYDLYWRSLIWILIIKHYHPVLNLSYISTLIEQTVCNQLLNYTKEMGNLEELQSAYIEGHSMESVLLKVKTDILNSMDKQKVTFLILLNLSAAFDTVSHE